MKSARSTKAPIIFRILSRQLSEGVSLKDCRQEQTRLYRLTVAELKALDQKQSAADALSDMPTLDDSFGCDPWDEENFGNHAASKADEEA